MRQKKYSAPRRIFNSHLGVWKCDDTFSPVFDMLLISHVIVVCIICKLKQPLRICQLTISVCSIFGDLRP